MTPAAAARVQLDTQHRRERATRGLAHARSAVLAAEHELADATAAELVAINATCDAIHAALAPPAHCHNQ